MNETFCIIFSVLIFIVLVTKVGQATWKNQGKPNDSVVIKMKP